MENVTQSILSFASEHKLAVAAGVVAAPIALYGIHFFNRPQNLPPGPYGYPYIGSMMEFTNDITGDFQRLGKKYGNIFCLWTGANKYIIVLNGYKVIKEAYITKGTQFCDREPDEYFGGYDIPDNIFNSRYDENYKTTRKITTQGIRKFVSTNLEAVIQNEMRKFAEYLNGLNKSSVELEDPIQQMISNVVSATLFSKTYPFGHPDLLFLRNGAVNLLDVGGSYVFSTLLADTVFSGKPKFSARKRMDNWLKYIVTEVNHHLSCLDEANPRDITDLYLISGALDKVGMELVCNNLLGLIPDAIISGCIAFEWMINYLMEYPQYLEGIRSEIQKSGCEFVKLEHKSQLPMLEAFMVEVLRIRSPQVLGFLNKPAKGATLCGYNIPEHASVVANYMSVHFDANIDPEPFEFKPERFIKDGRFLSDDTFVTFGAGRRKCLGEHLVRNLLFVLLANFIRTYDISTNDHICLGSNPESGLNRPQKIQVQLKKR